MQYRAILGEARQTSQQIFGWLEQVLSAAEFDAILAAASNTTSGTSISDAPLFSVSCVAQELQHGAASVTDSRCRQHEAFAFNILVGHAFLLSAAAHSGLTCRCTMASWLLSQFSSMLLLLGHDAPSLNTYFYSIATWMLLSFFLCLSVSLWNGRAEKIGPSFCSCFASQSRASPSFGYKGLTSSGESAETAEQYFDSECSESLQTKGDSIRIILDDGTLKPVSKLKNQQNVVAFDPLIGQLVSTKVEEVAESDHKSVNLVNIQCNSGIQATCPNSCLVLTQGADANFKEIKAAELSTGAKVVVFNVSEETVAGVTVQPESHELNTLNIACKRGFLLAANRQCDTAIAIRHGLQTIDCWGPYRAKMQTGQDFKFSSSLPSDMSSGGATVFKLGPQLARELALSDFARIPKGMDGILYSCGSQNHPHSCTPCWFNSRQKGCADGILCSQCHYPHPEMRASSKKRKARRKRREVKQPEQPGFATPAILQTVKNSFVEWVLQEDSGCSPCMRRAHSAPALFPQLSEPNTP